MILNDHIRLQCVCVWIKINVLKTLECKICLEKHHHVVPKPWLFLFWNTHLLAEYRAAFFLAVRANGDACCGAPKTAKHSIKVSYTKKKKKVGIVKVFNQKLVVNCTTNYKEMASDF